MMRSRFYHATLVVLASFAPTSFTFGSDGDAVKGAEVFAACAACHAADQPARTGPDLRGVYGRKAGSVLGFRYSRSKRS